jgi:putative redox protein
VEGDREDGATPAPFVNLRLKYIFKGNLKPEKVEQAIKLSMEKYCSVTIMLEKSAKISWEYQIL